MSPHHRPAVIVVLAAALGACGSAEPDTSAGETDEAGGADITMRDNVFEPSSLEVAAGTEVVAENAGQRAHNWVSRDAGLNSGDLGPGETTSFTFTDPGTYEYVCTYHPGMEGTVTVTG